MLMMVYPHVSIMVLAWIIADVAMPVLIGLSRRFRWLDHPYGHKTHNRPTPIIGGLGVYLAITLSLLFTLYPIDLEPFRPLLGIFLGATLVLILGAIDDFRPINALVKLAVLALATLTISRFGVCVSFFAGYESNPLNLLITLIWIVGVTSATNSLDHANGATAGSTAIACGTIFIIAWGDSAENSQSWLSYLALAVAGGCLGFLRHNLSGGKIFLGDNGSFLLGFLLASSLVFTRWSGDQLKAVILPPIVLTVPLYDITLSTILRIKNGVVSSAKEAVLYCGKDHLIHRLAALGLSPRSAIMALYSFGVVSGAFALAIKGLESRLAYLSVLGAYLGLLVGLGVLLDRAPVHPHRRSRREPPATQGPDARARSGRRATVALTR